MVENTTTKQPDNTAVRAALWRALHVEADNIPYIIEDTIGLDLINPEKNWQQRPDMKYTRRLRASIVARARFVEDIAKDQLVGGVRQYVLLGAGLDSFAQRNRQIISDVDIYEIDQPNTLAWKEEKLTEKGYEIPGNLHFVPVNFENSSWLSELLNKGFTIHRPAFVSCTGVTIYLTPEAVADTLQKMASLAAGSMIAIAFYLPLEELDEEDKPLLEMSMKGAAASGTPFRSFYLFEEIEKLAAEMGLKQIQIISTKDMTERYFKDRSDKLVPASGEFFLIARI
jgi:methyltransferase (TIGR00027 family)